MITRRKKKHLKTKLHNASQRLKKILTKYKSHANLRKIHKKYESLRNSNKETENFKPGNATYHKFLRIAKQLKKTHEELRHFNSIIEISESEGEAKDGNMMENTNEMKEIIDITGNNDEELNDNENEGDEISDEEMYDNEMNESVNESEVLEVEMAENGSNEECQCHNCKRTQNRNLIELYGHCSSYSMSFSSVNSTCIRNRKFKHSDLITNDSNINYTLCNQCSEYLTLSENCDKEIFCWPGFLINLLENSSVHIKYGEKIWRFIPFQFRYWWLDYVRDRYPAIYSHVTLIQPKTIFDDVTPELKSWNNGIAKSTLPDLATICDDLLLPTIMCPWGDSVFLHKCGSVQLDAIFQRYIQYCELKMINSNNLPNVKYVREDYIRNEDDDDCYLSNPQWKIRPSIAFINGTPRVLTCSDHDGGSKEMMIHTCRWEHNLPCIQPDQIAQVVVQSRTIRRGKASTYSNEWQMFAQNGSFGGLDTCNHVEFGRFDMHSYLRHNIEDRCIQNRFDTNAHLDTLVKHKIISNEMVQCMRNSSQKFSRETQYQKYYKGATFIPVEIAISIQEDIGDRTIAIIYNHSSDSNAPGVEVKFPRYWPLHLYPCQIMSSYGIQIVNVPSFRGDTRNKSIWLISAMITQVEMAWKCFFNATRKSSHWYGWFLTYLSKQCFVLGRRQHCKDPFKSNQVRTIEQLRNKIPPDLSIQELMNAVDNIIYIEVQNFEMSTIVEVCENGSIIQNEVLILSKQNELLTTNYSNALDYMKELNIASTQFKLCCIIITNDIGRSNNWKGDIYTRHHDKAYSKFWYQGRTSKFPIKKEPSPHLKAGKEYTFVYTRSIKTEFTSMRNRYLRLLGGQAHVHCSQHQKPLIISYKKTSKCQCSKRSMYCCSHHDCEIQICKRCFNQFNSETVTYVQCTNNDNNISSFNDEDDDSTVTSTDTNKDSNEIVEEDLENFVTTSRESEFLVDDVLLMRDNINTNQEDIDFEDNFIPTTNAGEIPLEVEEKVKYGFKFTGCNILNNVGSLLTRSSYDIKKSRYVNHFMQKICSSTNCESIPLIYPEGMLFPSIHWKSSTDNCSILGAIPSSLLNEKAKSYGFASIQEHIRTRLTCPSSATSTDPRYITHCYDVMSNLAASQSDTRLIINRGLTVSEDKYGNLGVRGNNDSSLLGSVDSKQMVKNLCTSQKKVSWSFFFTFTANQSQHFGLRKIKKWIDEKGWKDQFPKYNELNDNDQKEIDEAMRQSAAGLMLRIWEEVSKLFLDFLTTSPHSPYKNINATFARREYQSNSGNLAHSHIILAVDWEVLSTEEKQFVENLACGSAFDVVKSCDIQKYIDLNLISSRSDVEVLVDNATLFLTHKCNNRCLVKTADGNFRCRMPKYIFMTNDNTKQNFVNLPNSISDQCWDRLYKIGIANPIYNGSGERNIFQSSLNYFHPKRWIPAVVPGEKMISPYESQTFCVCRSMQNCQRLDQAGGCCKYTCKYLGKIDKQNFVTVCTNKEKKGSLQTNSTYLHNTKITTSDIQQEKERKENRDNKHPQGRCISLTEMLHVMLRYPEVYTDLVFISISTMPLELRCTKVIPTDSEFDDGYYSTSISEHIRSNKSNFQFWRKHSINETVIIDDLKQSKMGYDKITQFSLRPLELKPIINMVGHYYRWFHIDMKNKISGEEMNINLDENLKCSSWIDALQRQVKLRKTALKEVMEWCTELEIENEFQPGREEIIQIFREINDVLTLDPINRSEDQDEFYSHILKNLLYVDEKPQHLPIPVFSYVRPTNGINFLNHLLLSMGRFETEIDLMSNASIKECFRKAHLIGTNDDECSLQEYSNKVLLKYIEDQVRYFPNSMKIIDSFIVTAGIILDSAIVKGEIALTDMPPVQYSILARSLDEDIVKNRQNQIEKSIDAILLELEDLIERCNIPSKSELMNASLSNRVNWDPVTSFCRGPQQSEASFLEQKLAIQTCKKLMDSHMDILNQTVMSKSIGIRGHPGAGKTFCMLYMVIYAISQGLMVITTAKMSHRALQLGGTNWDKLLCLRGNDDNMNTHRRAELAIARIKKNTKKEDLILSLNVIFADELGQLSSEDLSLYDIILRHVRGSNIFMGGIIIIGTIDHLQIQPIHGRPFLTGNSIIPCFKFIALQHSVRATGTEYVKLQSLVRKDYAEFENDPSLVQTFREICSRIFTFVDDWTNAAIKPHTFRVFTKRFPAKEAIESFQKGIYRKHSENPHNIRKKIADDSQKSRYSHDWTVAENGTSEMLDKKCREPKTLLFEKGLVYICTFNDNKKSNSQKAILFDVPTQETLDSFGVIKVLLAPPGCKNTTYVEGATKEYYLSRGFVEASVQCCPDKIHTLPNNIQGNRKQYGLQHYIAGTIHSIMGDTLPSLATTLTKHDPRYKMWDKGQLLVIISRTKEAKDTIFVGDKESTLDALVSILTNRTQWTKHMEAILRVVTINMNSVETTSEEVRTSNRGTMDQAHYPFRLSDIDLPRDTSGYVYMLISLRSRDFVYVGKTKDLHERMRAHQSGHGSYTSQPEHLRPYAYFAYICGFNGDEAMMYYIEKKWKECINIMIQSGVNDPRKWATDGGNEILNLNLSNFGIEDTRSEMRLVSLFR